MDIGLKEPVDIEVPGLGMISIKQNTVWGVDWSTWIGAIIIFVAALDYIPWWLFKISLDDLDYRPCVGVIMIFCGAVNRILKDDQDDDQNIGAVVGD